ncbi:MAG: hypothetical protein DRN53_03400 [Thermoprotei archaeon]|nr:MAG: hypothetical protein DRN53_03400 [Thermoprotei archaeon]
MNIYHMSYTSYFLGERMVTISFSGCNFRCIGCLRKKREGDIYAERVEYIEWTLENIIKKIKEIRPYKIYLGGHEPTLDPDLVDIVNKLSKLDAHIILLTNGTLLSRDYIHKLLEAGLREIIISVKAFDPEKHLYYTGRSNKPVLNAIKELCKIEDPYFRFQVETLLIPGINDPEDIEKLAIFISKIDRSIKLFIEPWIPVVDAFREPSKEELIAAVTRAMRHLYIVSYHPLYSEILEMRKGKRKATFMDVFPKR